MGRPTSAPFPFDGHRLHTVLHPSSTDPTYHPKLHPDTISRFATVHFADRPTHTHTAYTERETDRWDKRQVYCNSAYALLYNQIAGCPKNVRPVDLCLTACSQYPLHFAQFLLNFDVILLNPILDFHQLLNRRWRHLVKN